MRLRPAQKFMLSNFQLIYIITFPSKNNSELAFLKSTVYYIRNCVDPRDAGGAAALQGAVQAGG